MTREQETAEIHTLDRKLRRDQILRKVFMLGALVIALAALIFTMTSAAANRARLDTLEGEVDRSESAAQSIAQEKQDQAQSVTTLCESGSVKKDAAGKQVCSEAKQAAEQEPSEKVQAIKGDPGLPGAQGPQGIPGQPGESGAPGDDGQDSTVAGPVGAKGQPGIDGVPGAKGDDSDVPGPAGANGADGKSVTGPQGPAGAPGKDGASVTGPQGPKGDTGAAGSPGKDGADGSNGADGHAGRGIASVECDPDSHLWEITYTDGEVDEDAGTCLATATNPSPTPTPTPTEETP